MLVCQDSYEFLKTIEDYGNDIIYCDPPYALGSEVIVRKDGKVDYAKAIDFMNKWSMPDGSYWERWFIEAYRTLKHGGYLIMFGMDRQLLLFKYYAHLAGFEEQQSLYWYFISNFPKATDLSKMIDKNAGVEREVVGQREIHDIRGGSLMEANSNELKKQAQTITTDITSATSDLAKKYDGYKYSISPLKQTNETIMVFQKPCKTGSPLHDCLAYENGDKTITVSALNIDGNKVGTSGGGANGSKPDNEGYSPNPNGTYGKFKAIEKSEEENGRYPAQTLTDSSVAERLDLQSDNYSMSEEYEGGCSKILHKCDYTEEDYELCQKYGIMKETKGSNDLCQNANIVELNLLEKEKEQDFVHTVVQQNNLQKIEINKLNDYLSVTSVEWSLWIMKQTELESIISALKNVLTVIDENKIDQNALCVANLVISEQIDIVLKVAKTLIFGIMESMENDQKLTIWKEQEFTEGSITKWEGLAIPMLSVLFAINEPKKDITPIITILKKYIMCVRVATKKYIEEILSCRCEAQYQMNNYDLYFYQSKVSSSERNAGCDEFEIRQCVGGGGGIGDYLDDVNSASGKYGSEKAPSRNTHPTLKPIALNERVLKLFKTPNPQRICYPFAGAGSEIIGGIKAGFDDWVGCEISQEYVDIANARIEYWKNTMSTQTTIFDFI